MSTTTRATRRAALAKRKAASVKLYGHANHANHLRVCSCAACGNPRKYAKGAQKLTLQERKAPKA